MHKNAFAFLATCTENLRFFGAAGNGVSAQSGDFMPKRLDGKMADFVLSEEQTLLSKQRTALSFMQTGLVFVGVGLTVAKLFSELFFQAVGIILIVIGFYEIAHAYKKLAEYNRRLKRAKNFLKGSRYAEIEYGNSR